VLVADRQLYILGEQGELVLAEATPTGYVERGRWKALEQGPCWNVPVLAHGRLYARNLNTLVAVDVARP